ncbi:MAG TPA: epoxide hydrolase [Streptomyces sp.]|uniref:epoxide hydrolase family protein n=1 Tax=Streptomyces sp. TaxID=1931 RepID=UPI002C5F54CA|nr:epoxide hydrolase [Streptomyces sp.]HWU11085.1 epoxide hydrolase [Streptomyces sp.]
MRPFRIDFPQADLDDLQRRLDTTRWPERLPDDGWRRGVPIGYLKDLVHHWRHTYDWRKAEAELNAFPQFRTEIDGALLHLLHVRSPEPDATPLLLTHGWPSSFVEFLDVIGPLTNPVRYGGDAADAFHVIIPALPGHPLSGPSPCASWDVERTARAWGDLMGRLGYRDYLVQGGDWGMPVSLRLAQERPDEIRGVHLTMFVTVPPLSAADTPELDAEAMARLEFAQHFEQDGAGWRLLQSTRPTTLSYGLTDSPVGQLAWIVEKFREWSAAEGSPEDAIDRDRMLTNVMLYWLTGSAGSSAQFYYESTHLTTDFLRTWAGPWTHPAPTAVAYFPKDVVRPVRALAERALPTLTRWTEYEQGGHFAALEQPQSFVSDLRAFNRGLR